jgi:acetyl esterase/lipase
MEEHVNRWRAAIGLAVLASGVAIGTWLPVLFAAITPGASPIALAPGAYQVAPPLPSDQPPPLDAPGQAVPPGQPIQPPVPGPGNPGGSSTQPAQSPDGVPFPPGQAPVPPGQAPIAPAPTPPDGLPPKGTPVAPGQAPVQPGPMPGQPGMVPSQPGQAPGQVPGQSDQVPSQPGQAPLQQALPPTQTAPPDGLPPKGTPVVPQVPGGKLPPSGGPRAPLPPALPPMAIVPPLPPASPMMPSLPPGGPMLPPGAAPGMPPGTAPGMPPGAAPGLSPGIPPGFAPWSGGQPSAPGVTVQADLAYGTDPLQHLDLYQPSADGPVPMLLFVHGGGWSIGDKSELSWLGAKLAEQGVLVAVTNYRLSPAVQHPAHAQDVARAVAWLYRNGANYGGDPQRLYVGGHSAGAQLASLVALDGTYLAAEGLGTNVVHSVVGVSGAGYDLDARYVASPLVQLFAAAFGKDPTRWALAAPLHYVDKNAPPFLLVHSLNDAEAPAIGAEVFARALKADGAQVRLDLLPGFDHQTALLAALPSLRAFVQ